MADMEEWKPNCKDCLYRKILAESCDCHVSGEDCDQYKTDHCRKMNDPDFVEWLKQEGKL